MAGTVEDSYKYMQKYTSGVQNVQFDKTGIPTVNDFLFTASDIFKDLNGTNKQPPRDIEDAMIRCFKVLGSANYPEKEVINMTLFAKKLYDMGMALQQGRTLFLHREKLADELAKQKDQMPKDVRSFIQNPSDDEAFVTAMASLYEDQVLSAQKSSNRRSSLSDEEEDVRPVRSRTRTKELDDSPLRSNRGKSSASIFGGTSNRTERASSQVLLVVVNPLAEAACLATPKELVLLRRTVAKIEDRCIANLGVLPEVVLETGLPRQNLKSL